MGRVFPDSWKFLVNTGGYTVHPRLVEAAIQLHPAVLEVAVLGVPDTYWGQKVTGFVVPAPGQELKADALLAFLQDKLSPVEIPKRVEIRESLPRSAIGKVLKAELLAKLAARSDMSQETPAGTGVDRPPA